MLLTLLTMLSLLYLTDSFNALLLLTLVSVLFIFILIEPLLLVILALIVTFWKMFYLPSIFVELLLLDCGVMNYVVGVGDDCLVIGLIVVVSGIIFGDVMCMLLLLLILLMLMPLLILLLLLLLITLLFLSDDLNVIFVMDSLFELLLLLIDPYLDLELEFKLEFKLEFIFAVLTTGLNVSAANDYLHSFSSLLLLL